MCIINALSFPFPSLSLLPFPGFRLRINTEKDHIDIYFSVVDQGIRVILPDVFNVLIIRNRS